MIIELLNPYTGVQDGTITILDTDQLSVHHKDKRGRIHPSKYDYLHWVRIFKQNGIDVVNLEYAMDIGL